MFTTGPWLSIKGSSYSPDGYIFRKGGKTHIAVINKEIPEWEANARLISKAPEMLATLQNVLALHKSSLGDTTVDRIENLISSLS